MTLNKVSLVLTMTLVAVGCTRQPQPSPPEAAACENGKIAYVRGDEARAIWVINPDGTDASALTELGSSDNHPSWSPDGKQIAFNRESDGNTDIYLMAPDGSDLRRLTTNPGHDVEPTWSPDGRRIAFISYRDDPNGILSEIYVINSDGTEETRLTSTQTREMNPAWSPDGTAIAFAADDIEGREPVGIFTMAADGSARTRITANLRAGHGFIDGHPSWSPDSKQIAFTHEYEVDGDDEEIFLASRDGGQPVRLTTNPGTDQTPAWSPDGRRIAFSRQFQLAIMAPDGTDQTQIFEEFRVPHYSPAWQPVPRGTGNACFPLA